MGGDKFDMGMFNGSVQAYLANIRYGVTTEKHGNSYYWVGVKLLVDDSAPSRKSGQSFATPYKPSGPDPSDDNFPLFGTKWVNNQQD